MENVSPIITARNLNLWYGDFKALKDISLDMGERELTALIGPSGCGKSTFLKTLNRMNDLVEGCRIEGTSKAMVDLAHKAGLYVSLWPGQSPEEFMRGAYLGADALNSDRAVEVKNWLDKNAPGIMF